MIFSGKIICECGGDTTGAVEEINNGQFVLHWLQCNICKKYIVDKPKEETSNYPPLPSYGGGM